MLRPLDSGSDPSLMEARTRASSDVGRTSAPRYAGPHSSPVVSVVVVLVKGGSFAWVDGVGGTKTATSMPSISPDELVHYHPQPSAALAAFAPLRRLVDHH